MFSRYFAVQVGAYGVDYGTFLLLSHLAGLHVLYANIAGKVVAGVLAFLAHRHITFAVAGHGNGRGQLLRYSLLLGLNIPLSSGVLALLLTAIPLPSLAKLLSDAVCMGITYLLSKHLVFTLPDKATDG